MGKLGEEVPANATGTSGADSAPSHTLDEGEPVALDSADSQMFATVDVPSARSNTIHDGPPSYPTPKPDEPSKKSGLSGSLRAVFGSKLATDSTPLAGNPPVRGSASSDGDGAGRSGPAAVPMSARSQRAASSSASGTQPVYPVTDWDRYDFISLLGQGGMGAVYKGRLL